MKKKSLLMLVCLTLAMTMTLGGTLAFLTDTDAKVNTFTVGDVDIELNEEFEQGATLVPGVEVEKVPTVTNTGSNDAWVWMTWSIPAALDNWNPGNGEEGSYSNIVHWNPMGATHEGYVKASQVEKAIADGYLPADITPEYILENDMTWDVIYNKLEQQVEIDGVLYNTYVMLYNKALVPGETTLPSVTKVYMDEHIDIDPEGNFHHVEKGVDQKLAWNINTNGMPKIYVNAFAIQKDGFETVDEAYANYMGQWTEDGATITEDMLKVGLDTIGGEDVTAEEANKAFKDALTKADESIHVSLASDVTYDIAAWQQFAMGSSSTKTITIDGNGHTITFNGTNSDWSNIVTNGAKLVINDAKLSISGHNTTTTTWNGHDIVFNCDVELNNVTSDTALAIEKNAVLNNVTISDASGDIYALWVRPVNNTVRINNLTVDMARGIKIDDQYLSDADKGITTLIVNDSTFTTTSKAAIIVKSTKGATIALENVDITNVAADNTNPVWVDEDMAAKADLVTVNGGSAVVEP